MARRAALAALASLAAAAAPLAAGAPPVQAPSVVEEDACQLLQASSGRSMHIATAGRQCPEAIPGTPAYRSPYAIVLPRATEDLLPSEDYLARKGLNPSSWPEDKWYRLCSYPGGRAEQEWGAPPRLYPHFSWDESVESSFFQQRLLAVAREHIGTVYQHHHIPQWNPYAHGWVSCPADDPRYWPWMNVTIGTGTAGMIAAASRPMSTILHTASGLMRLLRGRPQARGARGASEGWFPRSLRARR